MQALQSISCHRSSLDEFAWDVRALGMDFTLCQLDRQVAPCNLEARLSAHTQLIRFDVGNRLHHLLAPGDGSRTFGILARQQAPTRMPRFEFGPGDMLQIDPDTGLDAVIEAGFSGYTCSVSDDRLEELAQMQQIPDYRTGGGTCRAIPPSLMAALRQGLDAAMTRSLGNAADPAVAYFLDTELPMMLLRGWCPGQDPAARRVSAPARARARQRAVACIREKGAEMTSVEDLCRASASSYSTLERAFREHFGVSPKRYMIQFRLAGVRQSLLEDDQGSVTELAHAWGFTHMSKFAAQYRRHFGELPSQTRRQSA